MDIIDNTLWPRIRGNVVLFHNQFVSVNWETLIVKIFLCSCKGTKINHTKYYLQLDKGKSILVGGSVVSKLLTQKFVNVYCMKIP